MKSFGTRIKTFAGKVVNSAKSIVNNAARSVGKGMRGVGRFIGSHLRGMFKKIPGFNFIKVWTTKIFRFVGEKLFKKRA